MSRKLTRMEAERLRLYELAARMGFGHEGTLRQSRLLDELVVAFMKRSAGKKEHSLRKP